MPTVTRRDFLNGASLTIAAGLTPIAQWPGGSLEALADEIPYPPALTGLRGSTDAAYQAAHSVRDGIEYELGDEPVADDVDCVIVGAGISGLAAAKYYQDRFGKDKKILILDNHDEFGGHARRNEFTVGGRMVIGYGGSEAFQSPKSLFSDDVNDLLADLGVKIQAFQKNFDQTLYPGLGLSRGIFFPKEAFGVDKLVSGNPLRMVADDIPPGKLNAKDVAAFVAEFPVSDASKAALTELFKDEKDVMPGKSLEEKDNELGSISYRAFLKTYWGFSDEAANVFQNFTHDFFALGIDAVAAADAKEVGYPGFKGLKIPDDPEAAAEFDEPYIYHFPDGNASVARLLVRRLIPGVGAGTTMDDIVTSKFDYAALDNPANPVRLRLRSTVVIARSTKSGVEIGAVTKGSLKRITAKHCVLACYNMMIPYMVKELPKDQADALKQGVKSPLVYAKVAIKNWQSFVKLGVHEITGPMSFFARVKLDYPVSIGDYKFPADPNGPMCLHMVHVPDVPSDKTARERYRLGRKALIAMPFAEYEKQIRDQLQRMLGPGGFDHARDIEAITVNRWGHGYAYYFNSLYDEGDDDGAAIIKLARTPIAGGKLTIANSDSDWQAYMHAAIDQALRAVKELV